jgi:hypothetical protein
LIISDSRAGAIAVARARSNFLMGWMLAQAALWENHDVVAMRRAFCQAFGETYDPRDCLGATVGESETNG